MTDDSTASTVPISDPATASGSPCGKFDVVGPVEGPIASTGPNSGPVTVAGTIRVAVDIVIPSMVPQHRLFRVAIQPLNLVRYSEQSMWWD